MIKVGWGFRATPDRRKLKDRRIMPGRSGGKDRREQPPPKNPTGLFERLALLEKLALQEQQNAKELKEQLTRLEEKILQIRQEQLDVHRVTPSKSTSSLECLPLHRRRARKRR